MRLRQNLTSVVRLFVVSLISSARMHFIVRLSSLEYTIIVRESVVVDVDQWLSGAKYRLSRRAIVGTAFRVPYRGGALSGSGRGFTRL